MNETNINVRQEQLRDLQKYIKDIDKEITLILQSLQWDRKHLQQSKLLVTCKYDSNHRIPKDKAVEHEEKCCLKSQNYVPEDLLFPEPLDTNAVTLVKLSAENINDIINYAVKTDPSFKRSSESGVLGHAPLTLGRLQAAYSPDERRALHDAVAAAAPPLAPRHPHLATEESAVTSESCGAVSRSDALLALRDARRRRARHRRAAPGGYSHELRELISAQMEFISGNCNDEDADIKLNVTNDEPDDGCRFEDDSYRGHGRDEAKYLKSNRTEHRGSREDKRKEYERAYREDEERKYERSNREDKRREYEKRNREDKRQYEYDEKCKERHKIHEHVDRRRQRQYDKKYLEIKQEKDYYLSNKRKREERSCDYKDHKRDRERSGSRDNKKYHRRETRSHKHKSAERHRDRSHQREYYRNDKDIDCSYLKIKNEPPNYD